MPGNKSTDQNLVDSVCKLYSIFLQGLEGIAQTTGFISTGQESIARGSPLWYNTIHTTSFYTSSGNTGLNLQDQNSFYKLFYPDINAIKHPFKNYFHTD